MIKIQKIAENPCYVTGFAAISRYFNYLLGCEGNILFCVVVVADADAPVFGSNAVLFCGCVCVAGNGFRAPYGLSDPSNKRRGIAPFVQMRAFAVRDKKATDLFAGRAPEQQWLSCLRSARSSRK